MSDTPGGLTRYEAIGVDEYFEVLPHLSGSLVRYSDVAALEAENKRLREALVEALEGWDYAAQYKGEYFIKKHGDMEDIARLRATLSGDKTDGE